MTEAKGLKEMRLDGIRATDLDWKVARDGCKVERAKQIAAAGNVLVIVVGESLEQTTNTGEVK